MASPPSRRTIRHRRALTLAATVAATAAVWGLFFRGAGGHEGGPGSRAGGGVSAPVERLAAGLDTQELADQVLLYGFDGTDTSSPVFAELQSLQLGGVLIRRGNWLDSSQGATLIAELRAAGLESGRIPPLVVTAQEGGVFRALPDLPPAETELQIGNRGSPRVAEGWSRSAGEALRAEGVDLDLFPVADVAAVDSPLAERSFSDDPELAASLTAAAVRGCRDAHIACAAAHFPGLGAASQDTAQGPATVSLDPATLESRDLAAFRAAFAERVPAVVLSLAFYAAYDPVTPGALTPSVATGLLRNQLGYQGLAITDDLGSGAVTANYTVPQAAVAALAAGADMVQVDSPADQAGVRDAIVHAVATGELPEDRLREAAARVLELKRHIGLLRGSL